MVGWEEFLRILLQVSMFHQVVIRVPVTQRSQVLQRDFFFTSAISWGVRVFRFHLVLRNEDELAWSVSAEWVSFESHWRRTEEIGSSFTESINSSFVKVLADPALWEVVDERIEIRWLASTLLLDKIIKTVSDSGSALLLWDFLFAMPAANCDSKLRKLSLLPRLVNKRFWKSL